MSRQVPNSLLPCCCPQSTRVAGQSVGGGVLFTFVRRSFWAQSAKCLCQQAQVSRCTIPVSHGLSPWYMLNAYIKILSCTGVR